jgi:hypothetical protein
MGLQIIFLHFHTFSLMGLNVKLNLLSFISESLYSDIPNSMSTNMITQEAF